MTLHWLLSERLGEDRRPYIGSNKLETQIICLGGWTRSPIPIQDSFTRKSHKPLEWQKTKYWGKNPLPLGENRNTPIWHWRPFSSLYTAGEWQETTQFQDPALIQSRGLPLLGLGEGGRQEALPCPRCPTSTGRVWLPQMWQVRIVKAKFTQSA